GQIGAGTGKTDDSAEPTLVTGMDGARVEKIATSTDFTLALTAENEVYAWGNSEYGQCPVGYTTDR
ncbi:hypothetical protein EV182_003938, partial [Spiromyces aspiralis]